MLRQLVVVILGVVALSRLQPAFAASRSCKDILANKSYDCQTLQDPDGSSAFCVRFVVPGTVSSKFDASVLGGTFGCSCDPSGTPRRPKFNKSHLFTCVGLQGGTVPTVLHGAVLPNGTKIRRGKIAVLNGSAGFVSCDPSPVPCP